MCELLIKFENVITRGGVAFHVKQYRNQRHCHKKKLKLVVICILLDKSPQRQRGTRRHINVIVVTNVKMVGAVVEMSLYRCLVFSPERLRKAPFG